jgi:hypothetical protein
MSADVLQELRDIEEIKQLKARYFFLMDTKRWDEWRQCFTDDARFAGTLQDPDAGPDAFVDGVRALLDDVLSVHQGHMPAIELTGPDTARGVWAMYDWLEFKPGHPMYDEALPHRVGYGHYEEEYRKEDNDGWKICFMRLARLRVDRFPADAVRPADQYTVPSAPAQWLAGAPAT